MRLARYDEADALFAVALRLARTTRLPTLIAAAWNDVGVLRKAQGRYGDAGRAYAHALRVLKRHASRQTVVHASIFHNKGGLEHARGRYAKGEPWGRRALALRLRLRPASHLEVGEDLAALAALLDGQAKLVEATMCYRRALAIFRRALPADHEDVASLLNNLGALACRQQRWRTAERRYVSAIAMKERLFGRRHPEVAVTLNNLASLVADRGRPANARRLYRRALRIFEGALGDDHPSTEVCRENLASVGLMRTDLRKASVKMRSHLHNSR